MRAKRKMSSHAKLRRGPMSLGLARPALSVRRRVLEKGNLAAVKKKPEWEPRTLRIGKGVFRTISPAVAEIRLPKGRKLRIFFRHANAWMNPQEPRVLRVCLGEIGMRMRPPTEDEAKIARPFLKRLARGRGAQQVVIDTVLSGQSERYFAGNG